MENKWKLAVNLRCTRPRRSFTTGSRQRICKIYGMAAGSAALNWWPGGNVKDNGRTSINRSSAAELLIIERWAKSHRQEAVAVQLKTSQTTQLRSRYLFWGKADEATHRRKGKFRVRSLADGSIGETLMTDEITVIRRRGKVEKSWWKNKRDNFYLSGDSFKIYL